MTDRKNNLGYSAKIEYSKVRFLDAVENPVQQLISPAPPDDATTDGLPKLEVPFEFQPQDQPRQTLNPSDFIFCEKPDFFLNGEECPVCIPNPAAFVPDWRTSDLGDFFFDGRRCVYSTVVSTEQPGIPKDPAEINLLKLIGIKQLLNAYQKSELTTTVFYVINDRSSPEIPDPYAGTSNNIQDTSESSAIVSINGQNYAVSDFENIGSPLAPLLTGDLTNVNVPKSRKGYTRMVVEAQTGEVLLETLTKTRTPAVTIEFFAPTAPGIPVRALISVDVEAFQRIPQKLETRPAITEELDQSGQIETTIRGESMIADFREVQRALRRADRYATNAIKGTEEGRFYYTTNLNQTLAGPPLPIILEFEGLAADLRKFRRRIIIPAVKKALGIRMRELEKLRITFEQNEDATELTIKEVTGNAYGCKEFNFSEIKNAGYKEIEDLFNYNDSTVLGYVAALPNMVFYLQGRSDVVWLDFITQFTFPKVEFRTAIDLVTLEGDASVTQCAAEAPAVDIINKILNDILGVPDLLLDGTVKSICRAAADVIADRQAEDEVVERAVSIRRRIKIAETKLEALKEQKKELLSNTRRQAAASFESDTPSEYGQIIQSQLNTINQEIQSTLEEIDNLKNDKDTRKAVRAENRGIRNEKALEIFENKLEESLNRGTQSLESKPLAKILVTALVYGLEQAFNEETKGKKNKAKRRENFNKKLASLPEVQEIIDTVLGGWCGWIRLILEAMQCLLNGLGPEEIKKKLIETVIKSLKPHEIQNFLRAIGVKDPSRLEQVQSKIQEFTGTSLDSLLSPFTDTAQNSTFDYDEEYEKEQQALLENPRRIVEAKSFEKLDFDTYPVISPEMRKKAAREIVNQRRREQINSPQLELGAPVSAGVDLVTDLLPPALGDSIDSVLKGEDIGPIIVEALLQIFGVDQLFDILNDTIPGFSIISSFIKDLECAIPKLTELDPALNISLKSLNLDICALSPSGKVDFTFPKFGALPSGQEILTNIKNLFKILGDYLLELLIDIATQLLINALVTIAEAVLDLACNLAKTAGAAIADAVTGGSQFRDALKEALCPVDNLSDDQLADAMKNVFGALSNTKSGQSCVENLTRQEMADFIDAILVSTPYNELYNLLLGNANDNTLKIISALANASGSECIAEIFGNPDNVLFYFKGLGALIDAESTLNEIPPDVRLGDNFNVCPPEVQDIVAAVQANALSDRGLDKEEIDQQLEFLKAQAQKKMEDLVALLREGPYKDLPSLLSSGDCPPTGLLSRDPSFEDALQIQMEGDLETIQNVALRDLVGVRGLLPRILSDSEGQGLRFHRAMTNGFLGKPIGVTNRFIQFYSDDAIVKSLVTTTTQDNETQEAGTGEIEFEKGRIDQYGNDYPKNRLGALSQPIGGFPPTVGGYLFHKLKNYKIGPVKENGNNEILKFETRLLSPEIVQEAEQARNFNEAAINRRKQYIALWAAANHFVDYTTLQEDFIELDAAGFPVLDEDGETQPYNGIGPDSLTAQILNEEAPSWSNPSFEKRRATYNEMIEVCSRFSPDLMSGMEPIIRESNGTQEGTDFGLSYSGLQPTYFKEFALDTRRLLSADRIESKNFTINGRVVGIGKADYRDRLKNREIEPGTTDTYYNSNLARRFTLSHELLDIYKFVATNNYGKKAESNLSTPDPISLRQVPFDNPFELAAEFQSYPLKKVGSTGLRQPDYRFKLTYNMNPQNADETFIEDKYKYRVYLSETYNPYGAEVNTLTRKQQLELFYNNDLTEKEMDDLDTSPPSILDGPNNKEQVLFFEEISSAPNEEVRNYVNNYIGGLGPDDVVYSYETEFLREWFRTNVNDVARQFTRGGYTNSVRNFFDFANQGFFRRIAMRIAEAPNDVGNVDLEATINLSNLGSDGPQFTFNLQTSAPKMSEGFVFGYDPVSQPQAIVVDPAKYGGSELNPPYYLEPPKYRGWLGVLQSFIPQEEGCQPQRIPLYDMRDIYEDARQMTFRLNRDERLDFKPLCTKEAPYNSIRDNATVSNLESVIRATTRVHVIDFVLKIVPVLSQYSANFTNNFDDLLLTYLTDYTLKAIRDKGVTSPAKRVLVGRDENERFDGNFYVSKETIPINKYYFNFLETAVSNIIRKIDSGILSFENDLTADQQAAYTAIINKINSYEAEFAGTEATLSEEAIQTQNFIKRSVSVPAASTSGLTRGNARFDKVRARRIKVGLLYETIRETLPEAEILFGAYVRGEFNALEDRLRVSLEPTIEDVKLLTVSDPVFVNGYIKKRSFQREDVFPEAANVADSENNTGVEIEGDGIEVLTADPVYVTRPDGTIEYEVNGDNQVPFFEDGVFKSNVVLEHSSIENGEWPFILEKYIRIEDKTEGPAEVLNRPDHLRGVVNIDQWIEYINGLPAEIKLQRIEDLWESWNFGLRLSIMIDPAEEDILLAKNLKEKGLTGEAKEVETANGPRLIIPIAAGELKAVNQLLNSTIAISTIVGTAQELDLKRQYDTLCLVNELVKTPEFNTFYQYVFPLRRYLSFLTIYVSNAFYLSIGNANEPSPEEASTPAGDLWAAPGGRPLSTFRSWDKNEGNFKRSQRILKGLFMNYYNTLNKTIDRRSRDRDRRSSETNLKALLSDLIPQDLLDGTPWWQRRNRIDKPFDMFDNECDDEEDYF